MSSRFCKTFRHSLPVIEFKYDSPDQCTPCVYAKQSCMRIAKGQGASLMVSFNCVLRGRASICHCVCVCVLFRGPALPCAGEGQWLAEALLDSEKQVVILKSYKDHRKSIMAGAKLPEKWPILETKTTFTKAASTDIRAEGELMNRRRFITWVSDRNLHSL